MPPQGLTGRKRPATLAPSNAVRERLASPAKEADAHRSISEGTASLGQGGPAHEPQATIPRSNRSDSPGIVNDGLRGRVRSDGDADSPTAGHRDAYGGAAGHADAVAGTANPDTAAWTANANAVAGAANPNAAAGSGDSNAVAHADVAAGPDAVRPTTNGDARADSHA